MKTFGNTSIGIHGKELPKFASTQDLKDYWKLSKSYNENPEVNSRLQLTQTHKYWAKPDEILIADGKEAEAPKDPLKTEHVIKEKKAEFPEKINSINNFSKEAVEVEPVQSDALHSRWTENVRYFCGLKGAHKENPKIRQSMIRYEQQPLPSCFSLTGYFEDPLKIINQYLLL